MKRPYQDDYDGTIAKRATTYEDRIIQLENELKRTMNAFDTLKNRNKQLEEELHNQKTEHKTHLLQIEKLVVQERKQYTDMLEQQQKAFSEWQTQICTRYDDVVSKHKLYWSSIS